MFLRFEPTKSTKGASKMRRDLINAEISNLRDLLPLPPSTRQRLSQLQLMALVCVYVRKMNYFQQVFKSHDFSYQYQEHATPTPNIGFSKAMNGFMMMMTQNGKLLYISENAAEYLGHSMEDLLIHGDSVYDIIDRQDHQTVQMELNRGDTETENVPKNRHFFCRMNVSRNARRQMRFGDQKVVLVRGHYVSYLPLCSRNEPVFLAVCTPLAMPETRECVVHGATNVFTTVHAMDMKILHIDANGEWYLGWQKHELADVSWYQLLHWDSLREAQTKHRLITQSEQDKCCILLVKLQQCSGQFLWVHVVLQVKDAADSPRQFIVGTNQILSEEEASIMLANSWLYQYYGYQNQPCGMIDPRCQKFFRREPCYQESYQEPYYVENQEVDYPGYHVSSYVQPKTAEEFGCERVYTDRGPVDYSTHSPQSTISEERSPHHYDALPELVINSNMYVYPHAGKREYYEQYPKVPYMQGPCTSTAIDATEYPLPKRMRVAPPALTLEDDGMDRWNPSPPWSDTTLKLADYGQRFTYNHMMMPPAERAMVT